MIRDTLILFRRSMTNTLRNPVWVILGLFQPVLYLLLFAPLLDNLAGPGISSGAAFNLFTPGLLVLTALYSAAFVGFSVIADLRSGMIERLRVTPVHRLALPLGMVLRDVVVLLVQSVLLIGVATLMGLRANLGGLALLLALMALIGVMTASISYAIALAFKDENALASTLNTFILPLTLLSGIMLPMTLAPQLLQNIAEVNPLAHAVDAARALVNGQFGDNAIALGFGYIAVLTVLAVIWVTRSFRSATV
jgi:ABC-2 type transport system permease protein